MAQTTPFKKADIDSFFTASGQQPFVHRIIVASTDRWGAKAEQSLHNQQPPVTKIDLAVLEASQIDWAQFAPGEAPVLKEPYTLRPHQSEALARVCKGLEDDDRGKMIMACGTGKTLTSLKIAEQMAGANKRVLFMVPEFVPVVANPDRVDPAKKYSHAQFCPCAQIRMSVKNGKTRTTRW